jgi:hypothetical protein
MERNPRPSLVGFGLTVLIAKLTLVVSSLTLGSWRLSHPTSFIMEDALVQCVQLSLANCLVGNAIFFAEQMVAISRLTPSTPPSEHSLHLLAMCYIQNGRHAMAFETLKGCISPKNLYLRATAAIAISQYSDAEAALMPPNGITTDEHYKLVPNGAYGIYLLGVISQYVGCRPVVTKRLLF